MTHRFTIFNCKTLHYFQITAVLVGPSIINFYMHEMSAHGAH